MEQNDKGTVTEAPWDNPAIRAEVLAWGDA
jgi:hypothetical protein